MGMEMEILGMNFTCVMGAVSAAQIPARDCVLPLVSKLLGYCIVAASTTVKLPQIMKILKHNSVRGLSVAAFELEVVGYTIALAYCVHKGLPFSAYGELAFLLIQAIILVAIIYYYSQPVGTTTWIRALLYCAVAPTILAGQIDPFLFEALYASQHAIFFCARVPQIWKNYTNKSTGELSFLTCFMNFAGSIVRVFTSTQEKAPAITIDALKHALMTQKEYMLGSHARVARTGSNSSCSHFSLVLVINLDLVKVIAGSLLGIVMNGTILSQILIYQKAPAKKEKKVE